MIYRGKLKCKFNTLCSTSMNKTTSKKDWDGAVLESGVSEENMLNTMNKFFKYNPKAPFDGDQVWASLRNNNPVLMLTNVSSMKIIKRGSAV